MNQGTTPIPASAEGSPPVLRSETRDQHRSQRHHRLKLALISGILIRPLGLIVPIVTVPIFLHMLGTARFGLLETVGALAQWIALSNGGMGLALCLRLMDCHVSDDKTLAQRYVSTLTFAMLAVIVAGTFVLSAIVPVIDWGALFRVSDAAVVRELAWAVWIAGVLSLGGLLLGLPSMIYSSYQEIHRNNVWEGAMRVATLIMCVVVARFPSTGLIGALLSFHGVWLLVRLVNAGVLVTVEKPFLLPRFSLFEWNLLGSLLRQGVLLFLLQTAIIAIYQTDKIIVGVLLGPDQVAAYAVLGRYFIAVYALFMLLLLPLWPAHGEAVRRGDLQWTRRAVRISTIVGCACVALAGAALLLWGDWIIALWTRDPSIHISRSLIAGVTIAFALRAWVDSRSTVLNAAGTLMPQVWFFAAHVILNAILAVVLGRKYGVSGVGWAMALSGLVTTVWGYPWMMRRYIYEKISSSLGSRSTLP